MNPNKVTQLSEELHRALAELGLGCVNKEQAQEIKRSGCRDEGSMGPAGHPPNR